MFIAPTGSIKKQQQQRSSYHFLDLLISIWIDEPLSLVLCEPVCVCVCASIKMWSSILIWIQTHTHTQTQMTAIKIEENVRFCQLISRR